MHKALCSIPSTEKNSNDEIKISLANDATEKSGPAGRMEKQGELWRKRRNPGQHGKGLWGLLKGSVSEPSGMNRSRELKHARDFVEL